jgi:hypothetical protein
MTQAGAKSTFKINKKTRRKESKCHHCNFPLFFQIQFRPLFKKFQLAFSATSTTILLHERLFLLEKCVI